MDYEKKLKDALDDKLVPVEVQEWIEENFPELVESEDERMVKFIKNQLFNIKKTITENYELDAKLTKAIDWLEKKGEQKPADKVESSAFKDKLLELFQRFRWYCKDKTTTNGDIIDYVDAHIQELIDTVKNEPTEWSEEDSPYFDDICELLMNILHSESGNYNMEAIKKDLDWLISLKDRVNPQPKRKWSDEDEATFTVIGSLILDNFSAEDASKTLTWLHSLTPHPQWKPSDEQIEALDFAADCIVPAEFCFKRKELKGLLEQLKKLRKE